MNQRSMAALIIAVMLFSGIVAESTNVSAGEQQSKPTEHRFSVGKLNNLWKVYDSKNPNNRIIVAKRGDEVIWSAMGSNIFLNFPDDQIFGTAEASAADGEELLLTVSENAKPGRYTYSIFCAKDGKYATGDSPPVIIIQ